MAVPAAVLLGDLLGLELGGESDVRDVDRAHHLHRPGGATRCATGTGDVAGRPEVVAVDDRGGDRCLCAVVVRSLFHGRSVIDAATSAGDC